MKKDDMFGPPVEVKRGTANPEARDIVYKFLDLISRAMQLCIDDKENSKRLRFLHQLRNTLNGFLFPLEEDYKQQIQLYLDSPDFDDDRLASAFWRLPKDFLQEAKSYIRDLNRVLQN